MPDTNNSISLSGRVTDGPEYSHTIYQTGNDALTTVAQRADIALVLLDMILPDTHGLQRNALLPRDLSLCC